MKKQTAGPAQIGAILAIWTALPGLAAQSQNATIAPAPPMGWNSWDSYGLSVTESEFKQNAGSMEEKLLRHGWQYAVVDEGWYLPNPEGKAGTFRFTLDANGRYLPALHRFPSAADGAGFKALADWTHQHKMKFGIHIIRGIPRQAVERNLPIAGSSFKASDAANKSDTCAWNADNYGLKPNAAGQAYYDSLGVLYAGWGVDFVKIDCISRPYLDDEIRMFSDALRKTGRPIVLSLSPGPTPLEKAADAAQHTEMWRISDDFWDHWDQVPSQSWSQGLLGQFKRAADWAAYAKEGHWPDADMLPIGFIGPRPGNGKPRQTALTHDEQRTLITLWSMLRSPLIIGGNLTKLDPWTESLLTNDEVIAVDQHSIGGHQGSSDGRKVVWMAKDSKRQATYVALFNLTNTRQSFDYPLQPLGLSAAAFQVRDVWERKDLGQRDRLKADLEPHASALFALTARK